MDDDAPLVSCLLVARSGGAATRAAIAGFQAQDYAERELIVLDLTDGRVAAHVPGDPRIRYLRHNAEPASFPVQLARLARGPVLAVWEERASYAPWRLSAQVRGLLGSGRAISLAPGRELASLCAVRAAFELAIVADISDGVVKPAPGVPVQIAGEPGLLDAPPARFTAVRSEPVASCIMPTFNRRAFVPRAIAYFRAQDYCAAELVIVDDGTDPIGDLLPDEERIRYVRLPQRASIGSKRNLACELARGDVLVQWDDDDWYSPSRLRLQIEGLVNGEAELNGLARSFLLDLRGLQFWGCEADTTTAGIAAGTLAFTRELWERCRGYPDESIGEDLALLYAAGRAGARIASVPNTGSYIYLRHRANAWRFEFDATEGPGGWRAIDAPAFLPAADLRFYAGMAANGVKVA